MSGWQELLRDLQVPEAPNEESQYDPLRTPSRQDYRQQAHFERQRNTPLGLAYKPQDATELSFDTRLAFELALRLEPAQEVFERYGVAPSDALALLDNPTFQKALRDYHQQITDEGVSFRMKARLQAEDLLRHSYQIAIDSEQPTAVRADLIKWTAKVADLEPRTDKASFGGSGFSLQIVFANNEVPTEPKVINPAGVPAAPLTIEGD